MQTKTEIFADILQIMAADYAGAAEKRAVNKPADYRITDDMTDRAFAEEVQSYLLDFKDGHLSFDAKASFIPNRGFRVRRFENALYVAETAEETRLQIGDVITAVDGMTIQAAAERYAKRLEDEVHERQYWNVVLSQATKIAVTRQGNEFVVVLETYERSPYEPEYTFRQLDSETVYMKFTDFAQEKPILDVIDENREAIGRATNLVIDVRVNYGGNDMFYFPLLDYIFDREVTFKELFAEDEVMYTNYTERNCRLWIEELNGYLEQELDAETEKWAHAEIAAFRQNAGKGMVLLEEDTDYTIHGRPAPQNVYVLTDVTCGSSGDTFASNVKKSPKVTVVGRATKGIMDFFNVVSKDYGDYEFGYSITKIDEKYQTNETGVLPDVHIPWTPQHLEEDVDLAHVLKLAAGAVNGV